MKNIRIAFSRGGGLISWGIRTFTRAKVNHTLFIIDEGREMVAGADSNGLVMQTRSRFERTSVITDTFSSEDLGFDLDQGLGYLLNTLDAPYDYPGIVGFLWVLLGRRLGRAWRNPLAQRSRRFCSEAAVEMLTTIGFPGAKALDPSTTDPGTLLKFLQARKAEVAAQRAAA